jgi:hypothetical protein
MILRMTYDTKLETKAERRDADSEMQMKPIEASGRHVQRQTEAERRHANCRDADKRSHI